MRTLCSLVTPPHTPVKVDTSIFPVMKLRGRGINNLPRVRYSHKELVLGFKSQLNCLGLLCPCSTVPEGPQALGENLTRDFLPLNALVSLFIPHPHPSLSLSLSLLLPVLLGDSVNGQMFSGKSAPLGQMQLYLWLL